MTQICHISIFKDQINCHRESRVLLDILASNIGVIQCGQLASRDSVLTADGHNKQLFNWQYFPARRRDFFPPYPCFTRSVILPTFWCSFIVFVLCFCYHFYDYVFVNYNVSYCKFSTGIIQALQKLGVVFSVEFLFQYMFAHLIVRLQAFVIKIILNYINVVHSNLVVHCVIVYCIFFKLKGLFSWNFTEQFTFLSSFRLGLVVSVTV